MSLDRFIDQIDWIERATRSARHFAAQAARAARIERTTTSPLSDPVMLTVTCRSCGHRQRHDADIEFVCPTHGALAVDVELDTASKGRRLRASPRVASRSTE